MPRKPVIAVVGTGQELELDVTHARGLGRLVAEKGWILVTGGRDAGVMKAANEGAKEIDGSMTIGILPNRDVEVSPAVDVAIFTDTGEARNNIIVLTADVVIACGVDGAGTTSEVALAIKNCRPVILLAASAEARTLFSKIGADQVHFADTPTGAIDRAQILIQV